MIVNPLLETFLKTSEIQIEASQFRLVTNRQLRLTAFDKSTLKNFIQFLTKKNSIVILGLSFHNSSRKLTMIPNVCKALMNNDRLEALSLNYCLLRDNIMTTIARLLQTITSLRSLDLSDILHLSFDGIKILANVLSVNRNIKTLILLNSILEQNKCKKMIKKLIPSMNTSNTVAHYNSSDEAIKLDNYQYDTYARLLLNSTGFEELKIGRREQCCLNDFMFLDLGEDDMWLHTPDVSGLKIEHISHHSLNSAAEILKKRLSRHLCYSHTGKIWKIRIT